MRSRQTKLEKEYATRSSTRDAEAVSRMMNVMGETSDTATSKYPKIPKPNLHKYALQYRNDPQGFVTAIFRYYINAIIKSKTETKYPVLLAQTYIKVHFGLEFRGHYPDIENVIKNARYNHRIAGIEAFFNALKRYPRARAQDKRSMQRRPIDHKKSISDYRNVAKDLYPGTHSTKKKKKKKDGHQKIFGKKVHGNSISANTGLHDEKIGWHGYNDGDIDITEILAAFGVFGSTMPSRLTKFKTYNKFLVALETIKFSIARYTMSSDQGTVLTGVGDEIKKVILSDYVGAVFFLSTLYKQVATTINTQSKQRLLNQLDILATKYQLPKFDSGFYYVSPKTGKPRYKPSIKHKNYFIVLNQDESGYENENSANTAYYKVEGGKMKYYNLDK